MTVAISYEVGESMPCYHPIVASRFVGLGEDIMYPGDKLLSFTPSYGDPLFKDVLLPCRKCVGCRLSKSREWANRILMEQLYHSESWFLTLTYDDEHLPRRYAADIATGEVIDEAIHGTLWKRDVQLFLKRLRFDGQSFRYYMAGEYGTKQMRPHYHLIMFGLHLQDLKPLRRNFCGQQYWTSDYIDKFWDKGYHILGKVSWQSAAYVARYTMKKATHGIDKSWYQKLNIEPEYQAMSLKPGIGYQYYVDHPDMFRFKYFNMSTPDGGIKITPPEYFRKRYNATHPLEARYRFFDSQQELILKMHLKKSLTDLDFDDILKVEEEKSLDKLSHQIREL